MMQASDSEWVQIPPPQSFSTKYIKYLMFVERSAGRQKGFAAYSVVFL